MATYSLSGSGIQAITPGTARIYVLVDFIRPDAENGLAAPVNYYHIGLLRAGTSGFYSRVIPVDGENIYADIPTDTDSIGYALFGGSTIVLSEDTPVGPTSAADDFNRADDATGLGADWVNVFATPVFTISSNKAVPSAFTSLDSSAAYDATAFSNDQFSKGTLECVGSTGSGVGLQVRQSGSAFAGNQCYWFAVDQAGAPFIAKWTTGGVFTVLATGSATFASGDEWEIRAIGTVITVYQNGTLVMSATDSDLASGRPGVYFAADETSAAINDWSGGNA